MNSISKEIQLVAGAIRQALESDYNPGNSVNATDNPHQVGLIGRFNLYKAAEIVWERIEAHLVAEEAARVKAIDEAIAKVTGTNQAAPVVPVG
jgi:hypothetical protein